jgi:hypothetical protein
MKSVRAISVLALLVAVGSPGCSSCRGGGATAAAARLLPAYSPGVAALKSLQELSTDLGVGGLVAAGGVDAQRGWAAAMGILGFDLSNPATMTAAGLDPAGAVAVGVTRYAGPATTPVLFVQTTDPAQATTFLMQRAPLAGVTLGAPMQLGNHTVYVGTGEMAVAATVFDKTLAIAMGPPTSQPMGAIQELIGVEGGQSPRLGDDDGYKAAAAKVGTADLVGFVNVPMLAQQLQAGGLDPDMGRMVTELARWRALAFAMDVDQGVFSLRGFALPAAGQLPGSLFTDDATDVPVLDRIGGAPLFSMRATLNLPAIWMQIAQQVPEIAQTRMQLLQETGLNLDADIVGMLTGTFSVTGFRVGTAPNANDIVITAGITDPAKLQRVIQVVSARGMVPQAIPVGGTMVYSWNIETAQVSLAQVGNQAVIGFGRDAMGVARILMGQEGPSFRTQIADPNVAERYGKGGNGAFFVNLQPLVAQFGGTDPSAMRWVPVTAVIQSLGGYYEASGDGTFGQIDLRLAAGQTIASWLAAIVQIAATAPPPPPEPPPMFPTP